MQCILGAVEHHPLHPRHLSQQVIHHLDDEEEGVRINKIIHLFLRLKRAETHVVVRPQLKTAGADPEDAGEEPIRLKEVRDVKVLGQVRELFPQISRFLSEREGDTHTTWSGEFCRDTLRTFSPQRDKNIPFVHPLPVNEGSSSHPGSRPSPLSENMILQITKLTSLFDDGYLTQEEVRVFLFRCPFHELFERQSPVNEEVWLKNVQ